MDALRHEILSAIGGTEVQRDVPAVTNVRHRDLLERAYEALLRGRDAAASGLPEEFVLADLNEARALLEEMTGARTPDDLLAVIFSSFCIGK
jgi:tRNA modification GTPase